MFEIKDDMLSKAVSLPDFVQPVHQVIRGGVSHRSVNLDNTSRTAIHLSQVKNVTTRGN